MTITQGTIQSFTAGTVVTATGTFTATDSGELVDPTEVAFSYQIEGRSPVNFGYDGGSGLVERLTTGVYTIDIDTTDFDVPAGVSVIALLQFAGSGAAQASDAVQVRVTAPPIPWVFP